MLHSTRMSIIWGTGLVVLVIAVIQYFKWLPMPSYSFIVDGNTSTNGIGCLTCGCVTWCLLLIFAPSLHIWETWFLDKACICQHDDNLKQQGIQELGSFLDRSERMVLLLSSKYFERGWCTFEVATFMASKGLEAVDLVPLLRAELVISTFGVSIFGLTVFHLCTTLGIVDAATSIQPQPMIRGVPIYTFLVWNAPTGLVLGFAARLLEKYLQEQQLILRQVAGFRFSRAKFAEEADRAFVFKSIEMLFGSVEDFEVEVQTEVLRKVTQELGDDQLPLRFGTIIAGTLPWLWWGIDMACTDPQSYKLADLLIGVTFTFGLLPVWFVGLVALERCKLRLVSRRGTWVQQASSVGLFVVAATSSTLLLSMTLQVMIFEALPSRLCISVFWLVCFVDACVQVTGVLYRTATHIVAAILCFTPHCCRLEHNASRMTRELIPPQASI